MKRLVLLLALACMAMLPSYAQRRDSVYTASEQFKWQKLIAPAALMGTGAIITASPCCRTHINEPVRDWAQGVSGGKPLTFDDWIQYAPYAGFAAGMAFQGGEHGVWEQALLMGTSFLVSFALSRSIKHLTDIDRPNGGKRSFPSGHTTTAFVGAELVRLEFGPWWGLAAYAVAAATGFMRIYNNRHWTSDVIAGAGTGILAANIAYWLLPQERKLFKLDSKAASGIQASALPFVAPTPTGSCYGVSLALSF